MALGPKDHGGAVCTGAAIQLRIRGPRAGERSSPDVLVHDVVQEQGVQMVPFEPRRGTLEAAGRCLSRQELISGEGEGVPIPLSRREESRVVPHRPARWECTDRMFRCELLPNRLDVGIRSVAVWFQEGFESVLRRRGRKSRHRSRLSGLEPARGRRTHDDGTLLQRLDRRRTGEEHRRLQFLDDGAELLNRGINGNLEAKALIAERQPFACRSPSGCTTSWRKFRWMISASALIICIAFRASATPYARLPSCGTS